MENKEIIRIEESKKLAQDIVNKYNMDKLIEMIKDNKISFAYKDRDYRVRLLNTKEKDELDLYRRKKYGQLLQDKDILFEKEMIAAYKSKGIDIEKEIDEKSKKLYTDLQKQQYKLGEALEANAQESVLNTYKEEIEEITNEIYGLSRQKTFLLENSFEKTLEEYIIKILSYLSLEIKQDNEYSRAFTNLDDYLKADEELIGYAITYSMAINYRI